jgi:hypothetical protein
MLDLPQPAMLSLSSIAYFSLLLTNSVAILSHDRFLVPLGLHSASASSSNNMYGGTGGGYGDGESYGGQMGGGSDAPGVKQQAIALVNAVRTLMRSESLLRIRTADAADDVVASSADSNQYRRDHLRDLTRLSSHDQPLPARVYKAFHRHFVHCNLPRHTRSVPSNLLYSSRERQRRLGSRPNPTRGSHLSCRTANGPHMTRIDLAKTRGIFDFRGSSLLLFPPLQVSRHVSRVS